MMSLEMSKSNIKAGDIVVFSSGEAYMVFISPENVFLAGLDGIGLLEFYRDIQTTGELEYVLEQEYEYYTIYSREKYDLMIKERAEKGEFLLINKKS